MHSSGDGIRKIVDQLFPLPEDEPIYKRHLFDSLVKGGLSNYHLQSVDRSAGAFGFEIRPAYLHDDLVDFALKLPIEYKVPDKQTTKRILKDAFKPELEKLGLDWVPDRLKEGMPAAISNLAPNINKIIESSMDDSVLTQHALKNYLLSKTDIYYYELFAKAFLTEHEYAL